MSSLSHKVQLRAMEPEDLDIIYDVENDMSLWDVGDTNVPYSRDALRQYINNCQYDIYADRQMRLMIDCEEHVVGIIDIIHFDAQNRRAELGIVIRRECQGHGYGCDAINQVLTYCHHVLGLRQLYAYVGTDNHSSIAMLEHCGFTETAVLRDWIFRNDKFKDVAIMQRFLQ